MKYLIDKSNALFILKLFIAIIIGVALANYSSLLSLIFLLCTIIYISYSYIKTRDQKVESLSSNLQRLNNEDYSFDISSYEEGELSKLTAELNKTTLYIQRLNNQLIEQRAILNESLENISHQLKTPIASLMMLNELQADDELVYKSKEQLIRLNYLAASLLKLVKIDGDIEEYNIQNENIKSILKSVETLIEPSLNAIKIDFIENNEILLTDSEKLSEAIINILDNKVRYAKSLIRLEVSTSPLFTYIKISDDGDSIQIDERERIFERFYSGTNKSNTSIGIGLSIAKEYIIKLNGQIYIEDQNTFVIKLVRDNITHVLDEASAY